MKDICGQPLGEKPTGIRTVASFIILQACEPNQVFSVNIKIVCGSGIPNQELTMFWPFVEIERELIYCPLADFGALHVCEGKDLYAKAVVAQPLTGHLAFHNAVLVSGKIVVMERGVCDFVTKVRHAQAAGAIAVIVANTKAEDPDAAFVMDAGSRQHDELADIHIPAVMISHCKAAFVFENIRRRYLDRQEYSLTIKFLGAQAATHVMEAIENKLKLRLESELAEQRKHELEKRQIEATKQLRSRLRQSSRSSTVSTPSSTPRASPRRSARPVLAPPVAVHERYDEPVSYETSSLEESMSSNSCESSYSSCCADNQPILRRGSRYESVTNHWCPMTTALLILDVQNYFALEQNEKCLASRVDLASYYRRINTVMVPTIQDVLLASRASEGMEVVYSVVESATSDGRDRSRAHKHAGLHIAKAGFGANILPRIAPTDNDIVISRTGINVFESTNLDYTLRNLGVSHVVVLGISTLASLQVCIQSALERGYQATVLREGVTLESDFGLAEWLDGVEKIGCQVQSAPAFVSELQSFACEPFLAENEEERISETTMRENADAQDDDMFVCSYARSHLKQLYDEVVVDDSRGIGGFLWKFPSEGSNASTSASSSISKSSRNERVFPLDLVSSAAAASTQLIEPAYPRKCAKCLSAWVSDRSAERRHRKSCTSRHAKSEKRGEDENDIGGGKRVLQPPPAPVTVAKLGTARRVWCEVDSTLSRLQWREDIESEQDILSCSIPFLDILDVALLNESVNSFQIVTCAPRTVVFQWRPSQEEQEQDDSRASRPRNMDAGQWCEYLDVFSQYARQQSVQKYSNQQHSPSAHDSQSFQNSDTALFDEVVFARITRAIISDDVAALKTLLLKSTHEQDDEEPSNNTHLIRDESGSSLLIVALKLGASSQIIQLLLDAKVDCNAKNNDDESPLLLVAASGDDKMLQLLLAQADAVDVNQPCSLGATAFHAAANAGDLKILEMLCEAGAQTSAVDANGWTALHYVAACPTGLDAMHFLCELVPELLDCPSDDGNTALHVASGYGCVENVRALLQTAANPHLQNAEGHTAYHVALHSNKIQCAIAINEYMANSQELYELSSSKLDRDDHDEELRVDFVKSFGGAKQDFVSPPAIAQTQSSLELFPHAWMEYATPDGLPYYYNTSTGASSWHKPALPQFHTQEHQERDIFGRIWDDQAAFDGAEGLADGHELPLCLIPMVSLLVSLDDPTAAFKIEAERRKAREKRRANLRRHPMGPPPGSPA